jgi:hypothetical protein
VLGGIEGGVVRWLCSIHRKSCCSGSDAAPTCFNGCCCSGVCDRVPIRSGESADDPVWERKAWDGRGVPRRATTEENVPSRALPHLQQRERAAAYVSAASMRLMCSRDACTVCAVSSAHSTRRRRRRSWPLLRAAYSPIGSLAPCSSSYPAGLPCQSTPRGSTRNPSALTVARCRARLVLFEPCTVCALVARPREARLGGKYRRSPAGMPASAPPAARGSEEPRVGSSENILTNPKSETCRACHSAAIVSERRARHGVGG